MDIAQYIADLLKEKDEVGVPSFGTFYTKPVNAFFDQNSNSFIPPGRELHFKTEEADPSLLIDYISKIKNLSKPSSKYFAEKFGETLKTEINLVGKAELPPLGSFEKISDGFAFTPTKEFKHINNFGLEPVEELLRKQAQTFATALTDIDRTTVNESKTAAEDSVLADIRPPAVQEPVGNASVNGIQEIAEKAHEPILGSNTRQRVAVPASQEEYYVNNQPQKRNGWLVALALFTVLIAVGIIGYFNYPEAFNLQGNNPDPLTVDTQIIPVAKEKPAADTLAISDTTMQEDTLKTSLNQLGTEAIPTSDSISKVTSEGVTIPQTEVISYEIIGASLQTKKEAESYIRAMKIRGIPARIVENKPGRYIKVSIGSFTNAAKRDAELIRIKKNINKNAWPLDVKIKR